jgi:hypothetical protein
MNNSAKIIGRSVLLLTLLSIFTMLANWPIFFYEGMYQEQPLMYAANSAIHSFSDLINVYLHPKILEAGAPFFRPSGHFLIYQLLTSLFGWHNQNALLACNFLFLAMIGYLTIKLYEEFFPGLKFGGYVAYSFYLMNPALIIGRMTLMHFEFAYVFFLLLAMYCFVIFCKRNFPQKALSYNTIKFSHFPLLVLTVIFYFLAATFKESAIMLGPVLICYFMIALYDPVRPEKMWHSFNNKEIRNIVLLFTVMMITLALYLTASWGTLQHPIRRASTAGEIFETVGEFIRYMFSLGHSFLSEAKLFEPASTLRTIVTLPLTHCLVWLLVCITAVSLITILPRQKLQYKKSVLFLFIALLLFLILPIVWGLGYPWHLSLSLICEAILLGFGFELFIVTMITNKKLAYMSGMTIATVIAVTTYDIDSANINYLSHTRDGFAERLSYNAVFHPPALKQQLNNESVLIVEDSESIGDYWLGDSTYPLWLTLGENLDYNNFFHPDQVFIRIQPTYNGTLFRWAYLMPGLKEEVTNFKMYKLEKISDDHLLSWLRQGNNIFSVAYDKDGDWFDNTATFRKNLLAEQQRRHLTFHQYHQLPATALSDNVVGIRKLSFPDPGLCLALCDSEKNCKGFTYIDSSKGNHFIAKCNFYETLSAATKACKVCTGFIKAG